MRLRTGHIWPHQFCKHRLPCIIAQTHLGPIWGSSAKCFLQAFQLFLSFVSDIIAALEAIRSDTVPPQYLCLGLSAIPEATDYKYLQYEKRRISNSATSSASIHSVNCTLSSPSHICLPRRRPARPRPQSAQTSHQANMATCLRKHATQITHTTLHSPLQS